MIKLIYLTDVIEHAVQNLSFKICCCPARRKTCSNALPRVPVFTLQAQLWSKLFIRGCYLFLGWFLAGIRHMLKMQTTLYFNWCKHSEATVIWRRFVYSNQRHKSCNNFFDIEIMGQFFFRHYETQVAMHYSIWTNEPTIWWIMPQNMPNLFRGLSFWWMFHYFHNSWSVNKEWT